MSADTAPAPSPRQAPLALWRVAQAFLNVLYNLFGAPEDVAFRHTLTAKAHAEMSSWLRSAEAMLRRLLLIEAAAYPKPNTRPLLRPSRRRVRKPMGFDADAPEKWRVSFRCFPSSPARGGSAAPRSGKAKGEVAPSDGFAVSSPARGGDARRFRSAWPLAERYEALIRVFNDPAPYARRLAARIHAQLFRIGQVLRARPEDGHRIDRFEETGVCAERAWRAHFSSG